MRLVVNHTKTRKQRIALLEDAMYMMASDDSKKALIDRTSEVVQRILDSPELEDLTDEQLNKIAGTVLVESLKDKLRDEVKKAMIDVSQLKIEWLNRFDSSETKRSFERYFDYFLDWLGSGKSIIDVNSRIVDDYISYLKTIKIDSDNSGNKISNNTIRQRVAACSSFWKSLKRWNIVSDNPWIGCDLPKKFIAIKESEKVPTDEELNIMQEFCKKEMRKDSGKGAVNRVQGTIKSYAALKVLRSTGIRCGALPSLTIDRDGYYKAQSKGGQANGKLNLNLIEFLAELGLDAIQPFKDYNSFSKWFYRTCKKLNFSFSVHGIRHRFAVNYYNKTKDIVGLQKKLGHTSLLATQAYLATLVNNFDD